MELYSNGLKLKVENYTLNIVINADYRMEDNYTETVEVWMGIDF